MSTYQDSNKPALFDPMLAIRATGTFSDDFYDRIASVIANIVYPSKQQEYTIIGEDGVEETVKMPGNIKFINSSCSSKHAPEFVFPYVYGNACDNIAFYLGDDAIQITDHESYLVFSSKKDDIVFYSIVLIYNDKIYLVELSDNNDTVSYYELDYEMLKSFKEYLNQEAYIMMKSSYNDLLHLFKNVKVERSSTFKNDLSSVEEKVVQVLKWCIETPSYLTNFVDENCKIVDGVVFNSTWPELETNRRVSDIVSKLKATQKLVTELHLKKDDHDFAFVHYCIRDESGKIKEMFFAADDCRYMYVNTREINGRLCIVIYYYDLPTTAALENLCGAHLLEGAFLSLNDMMNTGLFPYTMRIIPVDDPQKAMEDILSDPTCLLETKEYKKTRRRPWPN